MNVPEEPGAVGIGVLDQARLGQAFGEVSAVARVVGRALEPGQHEDRTGDSVEHVADVRLDHQPVKQLGGPRTSAPAADGVPLGPQPRAVFVRA